MEEAPHITWMEVEGSVCCITNVPTTFTQITQPSFASVNVQAPCLLMPLSASTRVLATTTTRSARTQSLLSVTATILTTAFPAMQPATCAVTPQSQTVNSAILAIS